MSTSGLQVAEVFDAEFLGSLQRLRLLVRRVARGGRPAEQRSKDRGPGLEFADYRPYSPGDDLRAIDWNIYRRLGKVFLRQFEELEDLPLYLLPDVSNSFFAEEERRIAGLRAALALAAIGLNHHDSVGLYPFGEQLTVELRRGAGRGRLHQFAEALVRLKPRGGTDLRAALSRFDAFGFRRGICVVISDFFDPGGLEASRTAFRRARHRLIFVQLHRRSDRKPTLTGDLQLVDCESGHVEDVSITPAVLARYEMAFERFDRGIAELARKLGAGLVRLDCDASVVPQLESLFEAGTLRS